MHFTTLNELEVDVIKLGFIAEEAATFNVPYS
jgi:hypothetical protein